MSHASASTGAAPRWTSPPPGSHRTIQVRARVLGGPAMLKVAEAHATADATARPEDWNDWSGHTSLALALVYIIKLMDEPPPRTWAQGTTALRPASHFDGRDS